MLFERLAGIAAICPTRRTKRERERRAFTPIGGLQRVLQEGRNAYGSARKAASIGESMPDREKGRMRDEEEVSPTMPSIPCPVVGCDEMAWEEEPPSASVSDASPDRDRGPLRTGDTVTTVMRCSNGHKSTHSWGYID
jgi:hypothetical protein